MTAIQAVFIRAYEERTTPKPHTVYRIDIQANVRSWQMWRRYSEFDDLHTELVKATGSPPPCSLPPKHKFSMLSFRSQPDAKMLEERRQALEEYLRAIVSAKEDKWRETFEFKEFLGVPIGKQGGVSGGGTLAPSQFTSATWLDEHAELQAKLRDVWADINKRDALSDRGDVSAAHKSNVGAKSKLAGVLARIGALGKGLQELGLGGMSEGELQRRTDMVARLQDDCEKLSKVVSVARHSSARATSSTSGSTAFARAATETDREALLGSAAPKPARRVFGAPPQETESTRPLDNTGLLNMQQTQIHQQDNQLSQLTTILQRQRHLGEAISSEIALQIEMLDDLSGEVDRVGDKLHTTSKQMNKLS